MNIYERYNAIHGHSSKYPTGDNAAQNYADYVIKRLDRNRMILDSNRFDEFKQDTAEEIAEATVKEVEKTFQDFHATINP